MTGVSVVICCHNSAGRIEETLRHLAAQAVPANLRWEVIVVDNRSTDGTAAAACQAWRDAEGAVPLRVVREPRLGQAHARQCGVEASRHDLISFVDDDNWVDRSWVSLVAEVFHDHPDVGACGSYNVAVSSGVLPPWLGTVAGDFATGPQGERSGYVGSDRCFLYGAGLTLRREAWDGAMGRGEGPALSGRRGPALSSGDDQEICYRILLAGWRLWYEERLRLRHCLPARRLEWTYVRRLNRAFGHGWVWLDPYARLLGERGLLAGRVPSERWWIELGIAGGRWLRQAVSLGRRWRWRVEGDPGVLWLEKLSGRILELLRQRGRFRQRMADVRLAFNPRTADDVTATSGAQREGTS